MPVSMPNLFKSFSSRAKTSEDVENAAKTLLANIRFMSVDTPIRSIAITSAVANEGKSFVAEQLARAVASSGKRVLLVECDMRRRSLASNLGIHARRGLYAVVSGKSTLEEAVVLTDVRNMYFLDAEPGIPNPSDLMNSDHFASFLAQAREIFDYVVYDTPPLSQYVDAAVLGRQCDATVLVVRESFARRDDVKKVVRQLKKARCNLVGVVTNLCEDRDSDFYLDYLTSSGADANNTQTPALSQTRVATSAETMAHETRVNVMPEVQSHSQEYEATPNEIARVELQKRETQPRTAARHTRLAQNVPEIDDSE